MPRISDNDWVITDEVHDDAGGAGIRWQCPDCKSELVYADSGWWDLKCVCKGRSWDLRVVITFRDETRHA